MFVKILKEISQEVKVEIENRYKCPCNDVRFYTSLFFAIKFWCNELVLDPNITNYILQEGYPKPEIERLMNCIHQEWQPKPRQKLTLSGWVQDYERSKIYSVVEAIFRQMNLRSGNMEFIVLIAFVITAVGFWLYKINRPRQQQTSRWAEPSQDNSNPSSFTGQTSTVQASTKQCLVLVVSATQADFLRSLESKGQINVNDGDELCKMTKYLWLGSETDYNQKIANINQYEISKGEEEESEFDICLVYIKLKEANKGFERNVDKVERYDAFRKLDHLTDSLKVFPRLQMEAYGNFEVYNL